MLMNILLKHRFLKFPFVEDQLSVDAALLIN